MLDFSRVIGFLRRQKHLDRLLIAYSGGVDSHVLLHGLAQRREALAGMQLAAVYIDHGLHGNAELWGRHCQRECASLGVPFHRIEVDARPRIGQSPEEAARSARYAALADFVGETTGLLTAQHQDDQAETLLYQLLRGSGAKGLAGMAPVAALGNGVLLRPFLHVSRAEIIHYARSYELRWIDDTSNADIRFARNYLRHEVIPKLRQRWPGVSRTLARSAAHLAESARLQDDLARHDLAYVEDHEQGALAVSRLNEFADYRQRNLIRCWLSSKQLPLPSAVQLDQLLHSTVPAAADRNPVTRWPGCEVRRYRGFLYAMPSLTPVSPSFRVAWSGVHPLELAGIGVVKFEADGNGMALDPAKLHGLSIRLRQGGEKIRLPGRKHRQALKKLLQAHSILPWQRNRLPLLFAGEELAAVADLCIAEQFACTENSGGLYFSWQKPR